jgi:hypothetical protein
MEIDCYKKAISRRGGGQQSLAQSQRMHTLSAVQPLVGPTALHPRHRAGFFFELIPAGII